MGSVELSDQLQLDFKKLDTCFGMYVVPVVVQHIETKEVLIFVNEVALMRKRIHQLPDVVILTGMIIFLLIQDSRLHCLNLKLKLPQFLYPHDRAIGLGLKRF